MEAWLEYMEKEMILVQVAEGMGGRWRRRDGR
jgi:hypothetical protein